ncbi:MAG TPA: hypothetical protein VFG52_02525, partial [Xanthomonadales bacterium]|nr:hypothetical protein [Xanthomonadales bacterium]
MSSNPEFTGAYASSRGQGRISLVLVALVLAALPHLATAQDSGWRHTISPYLMAAAMDGTSGVGPVNVDVDLSASDIFSNLDFGAMLAYRGETENWAVMTDFIYMKLGASKTSQQDLVYGRINLDQTIFQLDVARRLSEHWELTLGARYWDVENALLLRGQGPVGNEIRADAGESWIDPLIGVRLDYPFGEKWSLVGKADYGGFGIGADSTWQASAGLRRQFSDSISAALIYRYIYVDYESG